MSLGAKSSVRWRIHNFFLFTYGFYNIIMSAKFLTISHSSSFATTLTSSLTVPTSWSASVELGFERTVALHAGPLTSGFSSGSCHSILMMCHVMPAISCLPPTICLSTWTVCCLTQAICHLTQLIICLSQSICQSTWSVCHSLCICHLTLTVCWLTIADHSSLMATCCLRVTSCSLTVTTDCSAMAIWGSEGFIHWQLIRFRR